MPTVRRVRARLVRNQSVGIENSQVHVMTAISSQERIPTTTSTGQNSRCSTIASRMMLPHCEQSAAIGLRARSRCTYPARKKNSGI